MSHPDNKMAGKVYEFGRFRLDAAERQLLRDGEPVRLTPKVFDLLVTLVENSGRLLEKEELMAKVWPDSYVEEGNINRNISTLRRALDGDGGGEQFVETVPKRGYRFVAPVRVIEPSEETLLQRRVRTHILTTEEIVEAEPDDLPSPSPAGQQRLDLPRSARTFNRKYLPLACVLVVAVAGLGFLWQRTRVSVQPVKNIAVLPFKFMGASDPEEYLGLGLTDALITKLGKLRQITVRPTSMVLKYQKEGQDIIAAGRALKADAVLDGRVQKFGESVRVTLQLVRVSDEAGLWTGEVRGKFSDPLALQDSISAQVARALALHLTGAEQQGLSHHYTENAEAYQAYLKGRYFWNRRGDNWASKAITSFEQAIQLDPNYALAHAGLADTYMILGDHGRWPPKEAFPKAKSAAVRALEIDDFLAEAHASLAIIKSRFEWDWPGAEREFNRAIEINPGYALVYGWYGLVLGNLKRFDEALAMIKQAQNIDPLSPSLHVYAAFLHKEMGQFDQAIAQSRKALDLDPDFSTAHSILGLAYEQKGMYEEAAQAMNRALSLGASYKADLAHLYAISGRRQDAIKILEELKELSPRQYIRPYNFAKIYTGLGEYEQALACLSQAVEDHDPFISNLAVEQRFAPLHADPRFIEMLRRVGLTP